MLIFKILYVILTTNTISLAEICETCKCNYVKGMNVICVNQGFKVFPKWSSLPENTRYYNISKNNIQILNKHNETMPSLKSLDLSQNKIVSVREYSLNHAVNLEDLNLDQNNIKALEKTSFHGLSNLISLSLSNNEITVVQSDWFAPLLSLVNLFMDNNRIYSFEPDLFKWPPNLVQLHLAENQITFMPPIPLPLKGESIPQNWEVHLEGNLIHCQCRRVEHNRNTLKIGIFGKIITQCMSKEFEEKISYKNTDVSYKRVALLFNNYLRSDVCQFPRVQFTSSMNIYNLYDLQCNASGFPKPKVSIYANKANKFVELPSPVNSTAVETQVLPFISSQFLCKAESAIGKDSTFIEIEPLGKEEGKCDIICNKTGRCYCLEMFSNATEKPEVLHESIENCCLHKYQVFLMAVSVAWSLLSILLLTAALYWFYVTNKYDDNLASDKDTNVVELN